MPYTATEKSIEQWKHILDKLAENYQTGEVTVLASPDPKYLRWHLSQALFSARELGVSPYNKIFFRFKKVGNKIYAYPRPVPESVQAEDAITAETAKEMHGITSLFVLVQSVMKEKSNILSFPDLDPSLLDQAKTWADTVGHEVLSDSPFTIQRKQ